MAPRALGDLCGLAEEIGRMVRFLLFDEASYITARISRSPPPLPTIDPGAAGVQGIIPHSNILLATGAAILFMNS